MLGILTSFLQCSASSMGVARDVSPKPYRLIHLEVTHALRGGRREGIAPQELTVSYGGLCLFAAPVEGWAGWANEFRNSRHNHSPHHVYEQKWLWPGGTIFELHRTPMQRAGFNTQSEVWHMIMYFLYLIPPQRSLLPRRKPCHAWNDAS